jgi:hypothetical protein
MVNYQLAAEFARDYQGTPLRRVRRAAAAVAWLAVVAAVAALVVLETAGTRIP